MILRQVHPVPGDPIVVGGSDARERLRALYRRADDAPGIRVNLISSIDGSAGGDDDTSASLTSRADRAVLGAIRAESDLVLVGAATLRAEGYLVPRTARLAVLTTTGDLGAARFGELDDPDRLLVLGPTSARDTVSATLVAPHRFVGLPATAEGSVPLAEALAALTTAGATRIVCEGGPSLAASLITAGLVDELCMSTSPRLTGGGRPVLGPESHPAIDAHLTSLLIDSAGGLYARWALS